MEAVLAELYAQVEQNDLKKALAQLKRIFSLAGSELFNETVLILGQHSKLTSDIRRGILTREEERVTHARITQAALSLIQELKEYPEDYRQFMTIDQEIENISQRRNRLQLPASIKGALYDRLTYLTEKNSSCNVLWIDNHPENNVQEVDLLRNIGLVVDLAESSEEASAALGLKSYQVIVSDRSRSGNRREGFDFHHSLLDRGIDLPFVFYVGTKERPNGVPPYAFGITDSPIELLHLIMDVVQRGV